MAVDEKTAAALIAALRIARVRGGARAALASEGRAIPSGAEVDAVADEYRELFGQPELDGRLADAMALGFLAGQAVPRRHPPGGDVTTFVMDHDLVVRSAEGDSILRLPWFDDELFVGRQLPDISEMPRKIRLAAVESYQAALAGERNGYAFTSYGHPFSVDAVPLRDEAGEVAFALAIASPGRSYASVCNGPDRIAQRLDREAADARARASQHLVAGQRTAVLTEEKRAASAEQAAKRARRHAERLRSDRSAAVPPDLTGRELDVLSLASHGLSYAAIAAELFLTPATVKTHLANIYSKLDVPDKTAAVAVALRHGLID